MPKYFLQTFGCQMNKNDSERISGLLASLGFNRTDDTQEADLLVINTCSVRQSAEDRVYGIIRNWQKLRKDKSNLVVAVTGCMPGRDKGGELKKKIKGVDLFFGIEELPILPKWLSGLGLIPLYGGEGEGDARDYLTIAPHRQNKFQAFITIQTGCNNFCAYCVVPSSRGREVNRPMKDILEEIKSINSVFTHSLGKANKFAFRSLISQIKTAVGEGCKEITLLGQVVNNYKAPDPENFSKENPFADNFAALLWEINQLQGLERVHFTAADPQYFSDAQIEALKLPKQVNYLHLPVQSGDNEILRKMNRKYTREYYIDLVKKIRSTKPEIAIGTDIIVGFCGETEEQFQNTVDLYKQCDFDISYPAMYSQRSGTAAAKAFKDDVSQEEKKRRWNVVQDLMEENTFRKNQKYIDQTVSVLVESCAEGVCSGNSSEMKLVQFTPPRVLEAGFPGDASLVGKILKVKVTFADVWLLKGKLYV